MAQPNKLPVDLMKHLPPYMATAKVHMEQIMNNIQSTKTQDTHPTKYEPMETLETRSNYVFTDIIYPQQWTATDFTGRLPVTSSRENKYLFIL